MQVKVCAAAACDCKRVRLQPPLLEKTCTLTAAGSTIPVSKRLVCRLKLARIAHVPLQCGLGAAIGAGSGCCGVCCSAAAVSPVTSSTRSRLDAWHLRLLLEATEGRDLR